ncbi:MAG: ABC transporter permease [Gemmataceae bacterium]
MNKFVAMLKDSFREAVDGWIFPVMACLIGIVVLLVLSFSVVPLAPEQALNKVLRGQEMSLIHANRGTNSRLGIFNYQVKTSEFETVKEASHPWESTVRFRMEYSSTGFGPTGMEVDDAKNPKDIKQMEGGLFGDAFKEAVRYWASNPDTKEKPAFSEELAREFVTSQIESVARLKVVSIEPVSKKTPNIFHVTTTEGTRIGWAHTPSLFFGLWEMKFFERPLGQLVHLLENTLVNGLGAWVLLLSGIIVTAGFIPNMLRKGAIDLLLTKPVSRPLILLYKYLGGLTFVFLLMLMAATGVWLAVGLKTGVWVPGLLFCTLGVTFYFAILYACSTFVSVFSRNAIVTIVLTVGFWFVVWIIGTTHSIVNAFDKLDIQPNRPAARQKANTAPNPDSKEATKDKDSANPKDAKDGKENAKPKDKASEPAEETASDNNGPPKPPKGLVTFVNVLQRLTPRTKDLDAITDSLMAKDLLSPALQKQANSEVEKLNWTEVLVVASAWIVFFLGLATIRFVTRSY